MDRKYAVVIVSDQNISAATEACVSDLLNGLAMWLGPTANDTALPICVLSATSLFGVQFVVTSYPRGGGAAPTAAFGSCGPRWLQQQLAHHASALRAGAEATAAAATSSTDGDQRQNESEEPGDRLFRCLSGALLRVVSWLHRKHSDPASVSGAPYETDPESFTRDGGGVETAADVLVVVDHKLLLSQTLVPPSTSRIVLSYQADVAFSVALNSLARFGATVLVGVPQPSSSSVVAGVGASEKPLSLQDLWGGRLRALAAATGGASWECLTPSACLRHLYERANQRQMSVSDSWERRRRRVAVSYFVPPATGGTASNGGVVQQDEDGEEWIVNMCSECMAFCPRQREKRSECNEDVDGQACRFCNLQNDSR